MSKVTVVNYGIGNLLSVRRALLHCGADVTFAETASEVKAADRLVVPGVGAFKRCMEAIDSQNLKQALIEFANSGKPYLGICVGMQMLMDKSFEFGEHEGLGLIAGEVKRMNVPGERIPFIGWKEVRMNEALQKYYFVHSYQAIPRSPGDVLSTYNFGDQKIVAAVRRDNVTGVQFHPEKSAEDGLRFIKEFLSH